MYGANSKFIFIALLVALAGLSCSHNKTTEPVPGSAGWHASMQELSKILSELLPYVVLNRAADNPESQQKVRALTLQLSRLTHGISGQTAVPSQDASLKLMAREFKSEIQNVEKLMANNQWSQAQAHLKQATQYCLACHTGTAGGSSGYSFSLSSNLRGFSPYEKGVYYTAVRQFESALVEYEAALTNVAWAQKNPDSWNKALLSVMAITTRVKNNPNLATEMISQFFDTHVYPKDLAPAARIWRAQTVAWEKEKSQNFSLVQVEAWLAQAKKLQATPQADLILNLRASATLNELLRQGQLKGVSLQKAYYYSAQTADKLQDLNISGFARDYYGICVEQSATNAWGKKCQAELVRYKSLL